MSRIGYARVSTIDQNLDRQLEQLKDTEKIFQEAASGANKERPQLKALLDFIREGDIVVVTELERLGRNNKDLTFIMNYIQEKGATLEVLNLPTLRGIEDDNLRRLLTEDDERLKHAFDLYLSGYSDKDVASMTGINERTFRRYRTKYGISR